MAKLYAPGERVGYEPEAWYVYDLHEADTGDIRWVGRTHEPRAHLLKHNHQHHRSTAEAAAELASRRSHFAMRIVSVWSTAEKAEISALTRIRELQRRKARLLNMAGT